MDIENIIITAMFTGIGATIGAAITELWIKPWIQRVHQKSGEVKEWKQTAKKIWQIIQQKQ